MMAHRALRQIEVLAGGVRRRVGFDRPVADHVVGIDVENPGFRVHCRAAPLRATVKPREDDGVLSDAKWNKLPLRAKFAKLLERCLVRFRSPIRDHVLGQELACVGRGLGRQWLRRRRVFSRNVGLRIMMVFNREQRLSRDPVE